MSGRLLAAYRRTGADPPFGDPRAAHGVGMEGYFWRFTDAASGRVTIVICGACRAPDGPWALVAAGAHPGALQRFEVVHHVELDGRGLGLRAGDALVADDRRVRLRLPGVEVDAAIEPDVPWPHRAFGALGPAHAVPGLGQYWHPHLLSGGARGRASFAGESWSLDGTTAYAEKNWGSVFAGHWWWGQAHGFADGGARCVAFAGGRLSVGAPTAVVVALDGQVLRLGPPMARTATATAPGRWRIRAAGALHSVELEAEADESDVHNLPVPVPAERRAELRSRQHLAGRLAVTVRRGRRLLYRGESHLAGLERGEP